MSMFPSFIFPLGLAAKGTLDLPFAAPASGWHSCCQRCGAEHASAQLLRLCICFFTPHSGLLICPAVNLA